MPAAAAGYQTTIGLEIHVELRTKTKLFCGCTAAFGGEPNTRVCPVCLGHPGTLPVTNETAIEFATKIATALSCEIAPRSIFHRKNYFYPDMPKNYQISQYDIPLGSRGAVEIVDVDGEKRRIGITRVHIEEDTGKSIHVGAGGRIREAEYSLEDFNRAGIPLVEIVTEPDLKSPEEARLFAAELRGMLDFLRVSDVRMEEGSLRVDANISVSSDGKQGIKAEIKNMNSLRSLQRALEFEEIRQREVLEAGGRLEQSTRHWDEKAGITTPMRSKEYSSDYRYFPEPDLVPIEPAVDWLRQLLEELPELPAVRRERYSADFELRPKDAQTLTTNPGLAEFFEASVEAAKKADAKQIGNWIANELMGLLSERGKDLVEAKLNAVGLAELVDLVAEGTLSNTQGKEVLAGIIDEGKSAAQVVEEKGIRLLSDRSALEAAVDGVIAANPEVAERVRSGEDKPFGFLVGQVMSATNNQGNPALINEILRQRLWG